MGSFNKSEIGVKLSMLRNERKLSMRGLARKAGVAASFLSKVESGKTSPTVMTLLKILEALNVTVADFFSDRKEAGSAGIIFRREDMKSLKDADRQWSFAFPSLPHIKAGMSYEEYKPLTKVREPEKHHGDVFGYVIKGELTLEILPEHRIYKVRRGDAFYLKAGIGHIASNRKKSILTMVVVQTKQ